MLRHHPYYEVLGSLELDSPSWKPTLAGLSVLELVDAARDDRSIIDKDWTGVRAVTDMVESIREGTAVRRPLMKVVEELRGGTPSWTRVTENLFAYGRALDLDGGWNLAVDVFGTVAEMARADREPQLAIEATTALGGAARRSGDWDRSAMGYAEAAHLANTLGDKASGLTVRVGTANTQLARGNLPAAKAIFDEVIEEADRSGLDAVAALAYHGSASVAHNTGRFADAVTLSYKALEKADNQTVKDTILSDLATSFFKLGMHDSARDAYLVTSMTSRYQWVRWQATANLMELASLDGMEDAFEDYGRVLKDAALDPRLRSYFLLYYGEGCQRFGREEEGRSFIEQARDYAVSHKIYQVAFEAEKALTAAGERRARNAKLDISWSEPVREDVTQVASALSHLREYAVSSPPVDDWT
jgi:tetratricopeptide (TPR) repeat protein